MNGKAIEQIMINKVIVMSRWIKNIAAISMVGFSAVAVAAPETLLWSTKLGGNISSSVAIGTHLYVGTADGKLQENRVRVKFTA